MTKGIGRFNNKIQLVGLFSGADGYGGFYTGSAQNMLDAWANIDQVRQDRNNQGSAVNMDKTYRFILRYYSTLSLTKAVYVSWEGAYYTIQEIKKVNEKTHYWEITATKSE